MLWPNEGDVFIDVMNLRAAVSKLQNEKIIPAANWEKLEREAERAVRRAGGWINRSGWYPCPPELAEKAIWSEE